MGRRTLRSTATRVTVHDPGSDSSYDVVRRPDTLSVEEPLTIRVDGATLTTTMRTPGDDFDLTLGWLLGERAVPDASAVARMMHCTDVDASGSPTFNLVDVTLAPDTSLAPGVSSRAAYTSSACGICGSDTIDTVMAAAGRHGVEGDPTTVDPQVLARLPDRMRSRQRDFARTGGVHAAALCTAGGEVLCVREDIGRHNAVDKVIGWAAREGVTGSGHVLVVSGRAGFELVQKCVLAGIPVMASVSAPSSLAVDLARRSGLTLASFVRAPRFTVYSGEERLLHP